MQISELTFYFFSVILIIGATRVITARNPVHAVMFLVLTFFTAACIWVTLEAEFLAIVLVLVYVGAVMVLFIFVVMMLDINKEIEKKKYWKWLLPILIIFGVMLLEMFLVLSERTLGIGRDQIASNKGLDYSNTKELGRLIYTEYVYAFEIAAVILLVAIVAAIALTLRVRDNKKIVNVSDQVGVDSINRIRLVSDLEPETNVQNNEEK
ncbi:MAG: NADH:ubiquinone oxidoreductase subunit J [Proteobacteria bacterium]|nr:NADH:ubiquinone oxidoreductase subunit J [Pseudomonadota bacterium]|tara:strand:- start:877 stop:1503 length:627 start_codon:yes stop_codon:yes gene_type:complete